MKIAMEWDLDCFFSGGSSSKKLQLTIEEIADRIAMLKKQLYASPNLLKATDELQNIHLILHQASSFVTCLSAQNVKDSGAQTLLDQLTNLEAEFSKVETLFDARLAELPETEFSKLLEAKEAIAFCLEEKRKLAKEKLPVHEEEFIHDFAVNGYHGWTSLWETRIGDMTFPMQNETLSFGQIENKISDKDSKVRKEAFQSICQAFKANENTFAQILNQLAGFRLKMYERRGWSSYLKEPLDENRLSEKTLQTMWQTIEANKADLKTYLKCKAALLKKKKLSWYDLDAPISENAKKVPYDEGIHFILKHFHSFSPKMGAFAKEAIEKRWVEAANRPNKRPGGFCINFPVSHESRIFMTYGDTMNNVFTLAHELGHAFHSHTIYPLPEMAQQYKMNVAETASTMAENIVTSAAIQEESDSEKKRALLDDHLGRTVSYLMNIQARFLFETRFYEMRKKGFVSADKLCALMEAAQREAYGESLDLYHPHFWAAKMHFYFSDVPFYNFPYTFGYLFSLGIYAHAQGKPQFEDEYISLLQDTGRMDTESLAKNHLNVDLKQPDFWQKGLNLIKEDINQFKQLC